MVNPSWFNLCMICSFVLVVLSQLATRPPQGATVLGKIPWSGNPNTGGAHARATAFPGLLVQQAYGAILPGVRNI